MTTTNGTRKRQRRVAGATLLLLASACGGLRTAEEPFTTEAGTDTSVSRPTSPRPSTTSRPGTTASDTIEPGTSVPATITSVPVAPGSDVVWLGGGGCGATLLDADGQWWPFRASAGVLGSDDVADLVVDGAGTAWIATDELYRVDEGVWRSVAAPSIPKALAIDPASGHLWMASYGGVSVYDGTEWTTFDTTQFAPGDSTVSIEDLTVDAQGRVWLLLTTSVAMYDGTNWTTWAAGSGLPDRTDAPYFESIAAGPDERIWVNDDNTLYRYDGAEWTAMSDPPVTQLDQVSVTADGRVWLTTYADGLAVLDGSHWRVLTRDNSGLPTDRVRSTAIDGQGRLWVGTVWGVAVQEGDEWTTYSMATSGLAGNCVDSLAISGGGPPLPPVLPTRVGSATGLITDGATPLAHRQVVLCSESPSLFFSGEHPCTGQPVSVLTTTDGDGRYTFTDVPVGEGYQLAWVALDGGWHSYFLGGPRIDIAENTMYDLDPIDVHED